MQRDRSSRSRRSKMRIAIVCVVVAAIVGGAAAANLVNNYGQAVGDIYGETVEAGQPSRVAAIFGAVPYAALETASEALIAGPIFKGLFNPAGSGVAEAAQTAAEAAKEKAKAGDVAEAAIKTAKAAAKVANTAYKKAVATQTATPSEANAAAVTAA